MIAPLPGNYPSDYAWDGCRCVPLSPILVDVAGDGFRLTNAADGVGFNFSRQGLVEMSWTAADADDAFLVLDRNANSAIDKGRELFG